LAVATQGQLNNQTTLIMSRVYLQIAMALFFTAVVSASAVGKSELYFVYNFVFNLGDFEKKIDS